MAKKIIVQWQPSYSIGIRLVDEQHMKLINLTNRLFASCMESKERAGNVFHDVIHEAVDYVSYHFSTEEGLMERVNYPEYIQHKKEHAGFVREVFSRVEDFDSGKPFAPLTFVYFLRDWVLHHISVSDKKIGTYLLDLHKSGELQKITLKEKIDG